MLPRLRTKTLVPAALLAACFGVLPAQAAAKHNPQAFKEVATISGCGGATLTMAAELKPAAGKRNRRVRRRALRKIKRATLKIRFEAMPLVGDARKGAEVSLGRGKRVRRFARFTELPAHTYRGIVRYRWTRGSRTVLSGMIRTRRAKAAGRRGKAYCSLPVGKPPRDTQPPFVVALPSDGAWKKGPLDVALFAVDDLSGVAAVHWRLDGGPIKSGRRLRITTEGVHKLEYSARDVAGNQTRPFAVTLRVDTGAPTVPTVTSPAAPTSDSTPAITWTRSTDRGSGIKGYAVLVRNSGGAIVDSAGLGPAATSYTVPDGKALAPGQYSAEVIAVDNTTPQPFTATGTRSFSVFADADRDGVADGSDNCVTIANPDQADFDGDRQGDACDADDDNDGLTDAREAELGSNPKNTDSDGDGVADGSDNCVTTGNAGQADLDGDGQGDACDADDDGDGVADGSDNCALTANSNQADQDGDKIGDACDGDIDGDGVPNDEDKCPTRHKGDVDVAPEDGCPDA